MAKTLASIQINFNAVMKKAQELERLAERLEILAGDRMEETMQNIGRSWTGEASLQYLKKGRVLENEIRDSAAQLRRIVSVMRTTARRTYEAERRAILLARQREG